MNTIIVDRYIVQQALDNYYEANGCKFVNDWKGKE